MSQSIHSPRRLLVTGGAGFIGANFIHYWLAHHPTDSIINLDVLTYAGNLANLASIAQLPNYVFVEGDINNVELVNSLMPEVDIVVHFAAESHVDRSILDPHVFIKTNVMGTHTLLDAAVRHHLPHFHHISTDEVFGSLELGTQTKFNEATAYDPHSPYSASKAGADHLVKAYGDTYGLPYTLTNCSNNYGQYHYPEKLFPLAITNIIEGKKVPVYGDGLNVRDWLYVQDHCAAIEKVLLAGPTQETYVIGGLTEDVSNLEAIKLIIKLMGASEDSIEYVTDRPGHDRRYAVDWQKIKDNLGWQPTVTLEEGLSKTIKWYQDHQDWWRPLKRESAAFFQQNYQPKHN